MNQVYLKIDSFPWRSFYLSNASLQEKTDAFYEVLQEAITCLPVAYVQITEKDKPWITPALKLLINKRYEAFRCRNFALYDHFKANVQKEIIKAKEQWKSKIRSTSKQLNLWKVANILCDLKLK